jgi:asparaginyl-tRNA synthetase
MAEPSSKPILYVDEIAGSDANGKGSSDAPYQSAVVALTSVGGNAIDNVSVMVRKVTGEEYAPISGAALKKAKKTVEINEKKAKKVEDSKAQGEKDALEAKKKEEKKLEDSKKIVLKEDPALAVAVKVSFTSVYC